MYSLAAVTNDDSQKCPVQSMPSSYVVYKPFQNLPVTHDEIQVKMHPAKQENNCTTNQSVHMQVLD